MVIPPWVYKMNVSLAGVNRHTMTVATGVDGLAGSVNLWPRAKDTDISYGCVSEMDSPSFSLFFYYTRRLIVKKANQSE